MVPEFTYQLRYLSDAGLCVSCLDSQNLDAIVYARGIEMPPSPNGTEFKMQSCLQVITKVQANSCSTNVKYSLCPKSTG